MYHDGYTHSTFDSIIYNMSPLTLIVCIVSAVLGVSFANELPTILDTITKLYSTVEAANAPITACFEVYEHSNYLGEKTILCGRKGQCINVPSPDTVSSIKFINNGRFFAVQKIRLFKEENCRLELDSDGYDSYGMSTYVYNDGYHNCDGYDLFSSWCDKSFNDNVYSFAF